MEWKNFSKLESYKKLENFGTPVDVKEVMAGENGAKRVAEYQVPMSTNMVYCYASKQVNDELIDILQGLADEAALTEIDLIYAKFGKNVVLPANHGRTVEFRKFLRFKNGDKLQEGVIPAGIEKQLFVVQLPADQEMKIRCAALPLPQACFPVTLSARSVSRFFLSSLLLSAAATMFFSLPLSLLLPPCSSSCAAMSFK